MEAYSNKQINLIVEGIKSLKLNDAELEIKSIIAKKPQWLLKRAFKATEEEYTNIAIKMYVSIGFDNALDLLNGKYGKVDYEIVFYLFNNLNIEKKGNFKVFTTFLFNNKKDVINNMRLILNGNYVDLFLNFDYFYNMLDLFIEKLGIKLNKNKVSLLLKERYIAPTLENPEVSGDILEDMVSSYQNKYDINDSETDIIDKNLQAYNLKLKSKTQSSIIKTDIPNNGKYIFELLPLNDVRNLVMGYRAGNCFRLHGDAFILFDNFLTNPHMRILSISTEGFKDFGMVLLMRNGNVIIAQGIEISKRVPSELTGKELYDAVKNAINYIIEQMNENNDEIIASVIGLTNNNTILYNHDILPFLINPLIENGHNFYNGICNYQALLSLETGKTLGDIKLFTPECKYYEHDNVVYKRNRETLINNPEEYHHIEKIIISLRYARFKEKTREEMSLYYSELLKKDEDYVICTNEWYIIVFKDGSIDSFINSNNPLVIKDYLMRLESKKLNKKR
jgi:hypothetical protein